MGEGLGDLRKYWLRQDRLHQPRDIGVDLEHDSGGEIPMSMDDGAKIKEEHTNAEAPHSDGVHQQSAPEVPAEHASTSARTLARN